MCLPAMEMGEEPYERCMSHFLDQHRTHLKTIKRELLRKDLLTHRLLHLQNQISEYRRRPEYRADPASSERTFRQMGWALLHDIKIQRDRISNQYAQPVAGPKPVGRFLHYAPFYISIRDCYNLFIYNSQTYINATFLIDEKLGRSEKCPDRTTAAIDLCRAVAARGKHLKPMAIPLCFAGLAFISDYPAGISPRILFFLFEWDDWRGPLELEWVEGQLREMSSEAVPQPGLHLDILLFLKEHPHVPWHVVWQMTMCPTDSWNIQDYVCIHRILENVSLRMNDFTLEWVVFGGIKGFQRVPIYLFIAELLI
jgi:hypothetical protein